MIFTKNTIDSATFECDKIEFPENIDEIELISMLDSINKFSVELQTIPIDLKALSFENKKISIDYFLKNEDLMHPQFSLNLINLIKNYNNLSDDFFNNERVIFKDLEEFLNVKLEMKDEIQKFIDDFSLNYFAMMISLHKVESNFLDNIKTLPTVHLNIIRALDFVTLSGICSKCKNIEKPNFYIADALNIFNNLLGKMSFTNDIMQTILSNIKTILPTGE